MTIDANQSLSQVMMVLADVDAKSFSTTGDGDFEDDENKYAARFVNNEEVVPDMLTTARLWRYMMLTKKDHEWQDDLYETDELFNALLSVLGADVPLIEYTSMAGFVIDYRANIKSINSGYSKLLANLTELVNDVYHLSFLGLLDSVYPDAQLAGSELAAIVKQYMTELVKNDVETLRTWLVQKQTLALSGHDAPQSIRHHVRCLVDRVATDVAIRIDRPNEEFLVARFRRQANLQVMDNLLANPLNQLSPAARDVVHDPKLFLEQPPAEFKVSKDANRIADWNLGSGLTSVPAESVDQLLDVQHYFQQSNQVKFLTAPAINTDEPSAAALHGYMSDLYDITVSGQSTSDTATDITALERAKQPTYLRRVGALRIVRPTGHESSFRIDSAYEDMPVELHLNDLARAQLYFYLVLQATHRDPVFLDCQVGANQAASWTALLDCRLQKLHEYFLEYTKLVGNSQINDEYTQYITRIHQEAAKLATGQQDQYTTTSAQTALTTAMLDKLKTVLGNYEPYIKYNEVVNFNYQNLTELLDEDFNEDLYYVKAYYNLLLHFRDSDVPRPNIQSLLLSLQTCLQDCRVVLKGYQTYSINPLREWTALSHTNLENQLVQSATLINQLRVASPKTGQIFERIQYNNQNIELTNQDTSVNYRFAQTYRHASVLSANVSDAKWNSILQTTTQLIGVITQSMRLPEKLTNDYEAVAKAYFLTRRLLWLPGSAGWTGSLEFIQKQMNVLRTALYWTAYAVSDLVATRPNIVKDWTIISAQDVLDSCIRAVDVKQLSNKRHMLHFCLMNDHQLDRTVLALEDIDDVYSSEFVAIVWESVTRCFLTELDGGNNATSLIHPVVGQLAPAGSPKYRLLLNHLVMAALFELLEFWRHVQTSLQDNQFVGEVKKLVQLSLEVHDCTDFAYPIAPQNGHQLLGSVNYVQYGSDQWQTNRASYNAMLNSIKYDNVYDVRQRLYEACAKYQSRLNRGSGVSGTPGRTMFVKPDDVFPLQHAKSLLAPNFNTYNTNNIYVMTAEARVYLNAVLHPNRTIWSLVHDETAGVQEYDLLLSPNILHSEIYETIERLYVQPPAGGIAADRLADCRGMVRLTQMTLNLLTTEVCKVVFTDRLNVMVGYQSLVWTNLSSVMTKYNGLYLKLKTDVVNLRQLQNNPHGSVETLTAFINMFEQKYMAQLTEFVNCAILLVHHVYQTVLLLELVVTAIMQFPVFVTTKTSEERIAQYLHLQTLFQSLSQYDLDRSAYLVASTHDYADPSKIESQAVDYYLLLSHCCNRYLSVTHSRYVYATDALTPFLDDCSNYDRLLDYLSLQRDQMLAAQGVPIHFFDDHYEEDAHYQMAGAMELLHLFEHHNTIAPDDAQSLVNAQIIEADPATGASEPAVFNYLNPSAYRYNVRVDNVTPTKYDPGLVQYQSYKPDQHSGLVYQRDQPTGLVYKDLLFDYPFDIRNRVVPDRWKERQDTRPIFWFDDATVQAAYNAFYLNYMWLMLNALASPNTYQYTIATGLFGQQQVTANTFQLFYKGFLKKYVYFLQRRRSKAVLTNARFAGVLTQNMLTNARFAGVLTQNMLQFQYSDLRKVLAAAFLEETPSPLLINNQINAARLETVVANALRSVGIYKRELDTVIAELVNRPLTVQFEEELRTVLGKDEAGSEVELLTVLDNVIKEFKLPQGAPKGLSNLIEAIATLKNAQQGHGPVPVAQMIQNMTQQYLQSQRATTELTEKLEAVRANTESMISELVRALPTDSFVKPLAQDASTVLSIFQFTGNVSYFYAQLDSNGNGNIVWKPLQDTDDNIIGSYLLDNDNRVKIINTFNGLANNYQTIYQRIVIAYNNQHDASNQLQSNQVLDQVAIPDKFEFYNARLDYFDRVRKTIEGAVLSTIFNARLEPDDVFQMTKLYIQAYYDAVKPQMHDYSEYLYGLLLANLIFSSLNGFWLVINNATKGTHNVPRYVDELNQMLDDMTQELLFGIMQFTVTKYVPYITNGFIKTQGSQSGATTEQMKSIMEQNGQLQSRLAAMEAYQKTSQNLLNNILTNVEAYSQHVMQPLIELQAQGPNIQPSTEYVSLVTRQRQVQEILAAGKARAGGQITDTEVSDIVKTYNSISSEMARDQQQLKRQLQTNAETTAAQLIGIIRPSLVVYKCLARLLGVFGQLTSQLNKTNLLALGVQQRILNLETGLAPELEQLYTKIAEICNRVLQQLTVQVFAETGAGTSLNYLDSLHVAGYPFNSQETSFYGTPIQYDPNNPSQPYSLDAIQQMDVASAIDLLASMFAMYYHYLNQTRNTIANHARHLTTSELGFRLGYQFLQEIASVAGLVAETDLANELYVNIIDTFTTYRLFYHHIKFKELNNYVAGVNVGHINDKYSVDQIRRDIIDYAHRLTNVLQFPPGTANLEQDVSRLMLFRSNPNDLAQIEQLKQIIINTNQDNEKIQTFLKAYIDELFDTKVIPDVGTAAEAKTKIKTVLANVYQATTADDLYARLVGDKSQAVLMIYKVTLAIVQKDAVDMNHMQELLREQVQNYNTIKTGCDDLLSQLAPDILAAKQLPKQLNAAFEYIGKLDQYRLNLEDTVTNLKQEELRHQFEKTMLEQQKTKDVQTIVADVGNKMYEAAQQELKIYQKKIADQEGYIQQLQGQLTTKQTEFGQTQQQLQQQLQQAQQQLQQLQQQLQQEVEKAKNSAMGDLDKLVKDQARELLNQLIAANFLVTKEWAQREMPKLLTGINQAIHDKTVEYLGQADNDQEYVDKFVDTLQHAAGLATQTYQKNEQLVRELSREVDQIKQLIDQQAEYMSTLTTGMQGQAEHYEERAAQQQQEYQQHLKEMERELGYKLRRLRKPNQRAALKQEQKVGKQFEKLRQQLQNDRKAMTMTAVAERLAQYAGPKTSNPGHRVPDRVMANLYYVALLGLVCLDGASWTLRRVVSLHDTGDLGAQEIPGYYVKTLKTFDSDYSGVWTTRDLTQNDLLATATGKPLRSMFNMLRFRKPKDITTDYMEVLRDMAADVDRKWYLPHVKKLNSETGEAISLFELGQNPGMQKGLEQTSNRLVARLINDSFAKMETSVLRSQKADRSANARMFLKLVYSYVRRCHSRCVMLQAKFFESLSKDRDLARLNQFIKRLVWLLSVRPSVSAVDADDSNPNMTYYVDYKLGAVESALALTTIVELCVQWSPVETRVAPGNLIRQYFARYVVWSTHIHHLALDDALIRWLWGATTASGLEPSLVGVVGRQLLERLPAHFLYVFKPRLFEDMELYLDLNVAHQFQHVTNLLGLNYRQLYILRNQ